MKNVAITGARRCELREVPDPRPTDNYALLKVRLTPLCTEFHQYADGHDWWRDLGHEAMGEVLEAAPGGRVSAGTRVVIMPQNGCGTCLSCASGDHCRCVTPRDPAAITGVETGRATYAERMVQQDWMLLPVPDDISDLHAAMAGCGLGPTFEACRVLRVSGVDTLLISGLGPVGLGAVVNGRVRGARVFGIESNPYRVRLARELGADAVFDPADPDLVERVRAATGGGADKSIECSSAEDAPSRLLQMTRVGGALASVGWGGPILARDIVRRGVTVHGCWHWNHRQHATEMWTTIRRAGPLLDQLVTHTFPFGEVRAAWELQLTGQCGKVVLVHE